MNITPKQKAMEIVREFRKILDNDFPRKENDAQYNFLAQCNAILCAENILKARELYNAFYYAIPSYADEGLIEHRMAKQCALTAANEIIEVLWDSHNVDNLKLWDYWKEVRQELEKL